jgi:hypothetical protein
MQRAAAALGLGLVAAGAFYARGGPRLTLLNTGLRVEYGWAQGAGFLLAAVGLALLAFALPRRFLRVIAAAAAVVTAAFAGGRFAYRLDAVEDGLADRGLFGSTRLAWKDVRRVDAGPALILVWGSGDAQVRANTAGFTPDQRATLDRTISRRVRESQPPETAPGSRP